jgi:hypothetical protein
MRAAPDLLVTVHLVLLLGFIGVTSLLMLVTVTNRLRLRRVLVSWRTGGMLGLPLWPVVFLAAVLFFLAFGALGGHGVSPTLLLGYLVGGSFWLVSSILSSTVIVSDYGLIRNVNCADRAVSWGQVVDYFEFSGGKKRGYVFFYADGSGTRRRLALQVPQAHRRRVQAILSGKLDTRFEFSAQQVFGKKALEG